MKAIDVDTIDWADGCFFDTDGTPIPIHHKIATIEMLRDWQPSCETEIRANERRKFAIWLDTNGYMRKMDLNISRVEEALYEYEKRGQNDEG